MISLIVFGWSTHNHPFWFVGGQAQPGGVMSPAPAPDLVLLDYLSFGGKDSQLAHFYFISKPLFVNPLALFTPLLSGL